MTRAEYRKLPEMPLEEFSAAAEPFFRRVKELFDQDVQRHDAEKDMGGGEMIARRQPIPRRRSKPRRTSVERDPKYLSWIRNRPCILSVRSCQGCVEAAHIGPHGFGQKASDHSVLPICYAHHRELHAMGVPFWERYEVDRDRMIAHYRALYASEGRS